VLISVIVRQLVFRMCVNVRVLQTQGMTDSLNSIVLSYNRKLAMSYSVLSENFQYWACCQDRKPK